MRIAEIIGTVTLSRRHPALEGGRLRVAVPLSLDNLRGADAMGGEAKRAEPFVVFDQLGAGNGSLVGVSEGGEAARPFPDGKPIDAYVAAIIDEVYLSPT